MPANAVYDPGRRVAMQATMLGVLLLAIGIAALLDQHITRTAAITLGPIQSNGDLHFQFPTDWQMTFAPGPPAAATAVESVQPFRTLTLYNHHLRRLMSPENYLTNSGLLSGIFNNPDSEAAKVGDGRLAGFPAMRVQGRTIVATNQGNAIESELLLCTVLPNRQAVTLWLSKRGPFTAADVALFDLVARTVKANGI
jgi:hypothetical protein